jgi:hypothetical protein
MKAIRLALIRSDWPEPEESLGQLYANGCNQFLGAAEPANIVGDIARSWRDATWNVLSHAVSRAFSSLVDSAMDPLEAGVSDTEEAHRKLAIEV